MKQDLISFYKKRIEYWTFTNEHPVATRLRLMRMYSQLLVDAQNESKSEDCAGRKHDQAYNYQTR